MKGRNLAAYHVQFRNCAGSMKHRCEERGGTVNSYSSYMEEYDMECSEKIEDNVDTIIPVSGSGESFDQEA